MSAGARIVFMGTPQFAVPSLELLVQDGCNVVATVTGADKPAGRGRELTQTPVKIASLRLGIPVLQPPDLSDPGFAGRIAALRPDIIVVVAFRILPPGIFTLSRLGSFNLHASLLPRYRGAAPINWAIINGDHETGVTTFFLEEHVDTGRMILQVPAPIGPDDDAGILHDRLAELGAKTVLETVRQIERGTAASVIQDARLASKAPKIFKDDCRVVWTLPAARIRNMIRGLAPVPAAWTTLSGKTVKLFRSEIADGFGATPGTLAVTHGNLLVACGGGALSLLELQVEGRKRLPVAEFLRGYPIPSGTSLR